MKDRIDLKYYFEFKENCSWEGETWRWYIPIDGNEKNITFLKKEIEKFPNFTISEKIFDEREVDILVENTSVGYMASHDKLEGKLDFSDYPEKSTNGAEDPFYKGDIREYVINEKTT